MNRLQTKCFLAAVGAHLLLLIILIVGPGFFHSKPKEIPQQTLHMVAESKVTDALTSGGGDPKVEQAPTPAPAPPAPAVQEPPPPAPAPAPAPAPEPPPTPKRAEPEPPPVPKSVKVNPKALIPQDKKKPTKKPVDDVDDAPKPTVSKTKSKKPEIDVDLSKEIVRKPDDAKEKLKREKMAAQIAQQEQDRQNRNYQNQRQKRFDNAMRNLGSGLSGGLNIEMPGGPGGQSFINYGQLIVDIYERSWIKPNDVNADETIVKVSVTIARDGSIISARVTEKSGNEKVDRSVERALRDVIKVDPFPAESKELQRTFNIEFNLKTKRQIG